MTTYGYVRVSTLGQNPERQIVKMRELGVAPGDVFVDHASGKNLERPEYTELMSRVRAGDVIVFDSLDRLGRSYADVTAEWRRLTSAGVDLKVLDLDFFDSVRLREMGALGVCVEDMLLSLLAYVAQAERDKTLARQAEGIELAKQRGAYKGRSPRTWDTDTLARAQEALGREGKSAAARVLKCSRATVNKMIEDGRLVA